ncbi:right-handed parallel beta-helix repeat-containing protein [Micromonospora sp. CA-263727]|uniref:right-handed parallel beta-helix repeat-containing protein n=1 Tax=Micromonospora sp. CA-263727 TaxID=3239967 RepID=UPI003D8BB34F
MSNDLTSPSGEAPMAPSGRGRRKLWVAAGVVGLTGVVGLAAVGGIAARNNQKSADKERASNAQASAPKQNVSDAGKAEDTEKSDAGDRSGRNDAGGGKGKGADRVREVPCDTDKLIAAITLANRTNGATLKLADRCTYRLTRHDEWGNGLPRINQPITLKGDKTLIERDATAKPFRILNVGPGGELTLKGLTVKGGQLKEEKERPKPGKWGSERSGSNAAPAAAPAPDPAHGHTPTEGAGLLVHQGGRAVVEESTFVQNHTSGDGGAIANFGSTRVRDSLIERNSAGGFGGGIFNAGVLNVEESKVSQNSSGLGGGGIANGTSGRYATEGGTVYIWKSKIRQNRTAGDGGGLFDEGGTTSASHSEITDNVAASDVGGVVANRGGQLTLKNVVVARNATEGRAGGIGVGTDARAVVEHSLIKENVSGSDGGGLYNFGFTVLRDTEVLANQAVGGNARAGGIFNDGGKVSLIRTKVAVNFATQKPGGVFTTNDDVTVDSRSSITDNRPTNCLGSPVIPNRCFG